MVEKKIDVVTIGETMVLFQPMSEGKMAYVNMFTRTIAGAEANVGIGLTRLGKRVRWISRIGNDPFGDTILTSLRGEGLDVSQVIRDSSYPTAVYFKEFKCFGDPNVYYYRKGSAASRMSPSDIKEAWFVDARHLHVTGITPALGEHTTELIAESMKRAKKHGMTVSFDPNLRRKLWSESIARETLLSLIPLCDVFLPGVEEAEFLLGAMSVEDYGQRFLEMGPQVVALKLGADGSVGFVGDHICYSPGQKVERVVDTVGAGDAFAAGFLSIYLDYQHRNIDRLKEMLSPALQRANVMGAFATQYKGDWEGLPRLEELEQVLSNQKIVSR